MLLIALVTSSLVSTAHLGNAPAVSVPAASPPPVVFAKPAPERPSPAKEFPRPQPPPSTHKGANPKAPQVAGGLPLAPSYFACYEYIFNPALDPKYQSIVNAGASGQTCFISPQGAPPEGW